MKCFRRIVSVFLLLCMMTACESEQSAVSLPDEPTMIATEVPTQRELPANDISRIDFDFFEDKMDSNTWNALLCYLPVLQNKAAFTLSLETSDDVSASHVKNQNKTNLNDFFSQSGETGDSLTIYQFSVFDLDSDGKQELIVCFDNLSGQYLVFHEEDGEIYAADFTHRSMQMLLPNGIYLSSGGAGCIHWRTLAFEGDGFREYELAGSDWNGEKAIQEYKIDGEPVDENTYGKWENAHFLQHSVPWYQPLEDGVWCRKTYDYSEWGTDVEELL